MDLRVIEDLSFLMDRMKIHCVLADEHSKLKCIFNHKDTAALDYETMQMLLIEELQGERFQDFLETFEESFKDVHNKIRKNVSQSIKARENGNKLLAKKNHNDEVHEEIWKLYSKSIALAPLNSEQLALGYGNRSYLLLHFNEHEECIKDIDRALSITKSDVLKIKLLCRKMTCLAALNHKDQENDVWNEIESQLVTMGKELIDDKVSKIIKHAKTDRLSNQSNLKRKMELLSHFTSDAIYVKSNAEQEKSLIAARDVKPGEIIMVLKPFVTFVNGNKFFAYCSYCFSKTWSSIPCDYCNVDMFCSETCKLNSWKDYHKYECKVNSLINGSNQFAGKAKMSLRAVCLAIKEAGSIRKFREKFEKSDKLDNNPENLLNDGNCCNNFWNVFNLSNLCHVNCMVYFIKFTPVLLTAFIRETNFFERNLKPLKGKELAKDEDFIFIGVLLLKLLMITSTNAEYLFTTTRICKKYQSPMDCMKNFCCTRGGHLTPMANFIKNNCNPNIIKHPTHDGKLIYYCFQPIKKNDVLSLAFCDTFYNASKITRQMRLHSAICTKCKCQACEENWPTWGILFQLFIDDIEDPRKFSERDIKLNLWKQFNELNCKIMEEDYQINAQTIQDIAKNVSYAIRTYNQPTFLTCFILRILEFAVMKYHGNNEPFVQQKCQNI